MHEEQRITGLEIQNESKNCYSLGRTIFPVELQQRWPFSVNGEEQEETRERLRFGIGA
jgi:hypothetical protein